MHLSVELMQHLSAAALAFTVVTYVVLDGTDLGVGMLFAANRSDADRHLMAYSILPVWDGNETWLVLGGGSLLAMFPSAYAIFLNATYVPLVVMLLALICRGVALEYRDQLGTDRRRRVLDVVFMAASLLASFCQGVVAGTYLAGVAHRAGQYAGNGGEWLQPFPLCCGAALVVGYLLLGACWLVWRSEGQLQQRARHQARVLGIVMVALLTLGVVWLARLTPTYAQRLGDAHISVPLGVSVLGLMAAMYLLMRSRHAFLPLFAVLGVVVATYAGVLAIVYPMVLPPDISLAQAASPPASQGVMLLAFAVLVPCTLAYSSYGFYVFRGKVKPRGHAAE
ncbi:cytochrome d ubiquinol oxidase subunit II [Xanthomonas campestris]|uniref:cytochrome d ubiquinol oxidase subunit II n=1 Tax=Xanthomonas campestris TaxID=339 RepID=UPI00217EEDB8|nr:cytochrome d ubiquinol oxidase subunit II [Xanthomonas campestris]